MISKAPITAVVITKNEASAIQRCLNALDFCEQVLVVDSFSTDDTVEVARATGAEVIPFRWDGKYPKKKQWGMSHPAVRNDWILHLDADEIVTPPLETEIRNLVGRATTGGPVAYDIPLAYHFMGRELRFGHRVTKRSLVDRRFVHFPEVNDLGAPGITEVEGHYQPTANGPVGRIRTRLRHDDPDPLRNWIDRHNRYSDWEAHLLEHDNIRAAVRSSRSLQGRIFDRAPGKALMFFAYSYFARGGFLDGRAGFDYAFALSWYYWSIDAKRRDANRPRNIQSGNPYSDMKSL